MKNLLHLFLLLPIMINATPDDGIREYDVLIGYNDYYYYSIKTIHYPTGNYFISIDSSFVIERDLQSGLINSTILIHSATHIDTTTLEDWETNEYENSEFKLEEFIIKKNIKYLYPEIYLNNIYKHLRFDIDLDGLKLFYQDETILIENIDRIEVFAPKVRESFEEQEKSKQEFPDLQHQYVRIYDFIGDSKFFFVMIESEFEPEIYQSIIVLQTNKFNSLRNIMIERNNTN